jgi:hypothetical protein
MTSAFFQPLPTARAVLLAAAAAQFKSKSFMMRFLMTNFSYYNLLVLPCQSIIAGHPGQSHVAGQE